MQSVGGVAAPIPNSYT